MIEVSGLSHAYGDDRVLDEVDWTISAGDRWALLGPSGAGKTTLVEIVSGLTRPNRGGTVRRHGDESINLAEWRRGVGWLSTDLLERVPAGQTLLDTVVAGKHAQTLRAERSGLTYSGADEQRADDLIERVGLAGRASQSFGNLSQGEAQLALVARALMGDPELLILDEPCAGLDPAAREDFLADLESVLAESAETAVVYVTHHVEEILPSVGKVLALRAGRVVYAGDRDALLGESDLSEIYGRGFEFTLREGRYWPVGTA